MKYLILLALLLPTASSALTCTILDETYRKDFNWEPPTFREANSEGIEKPLTAEEIGGYYLYWYDTNAVNDNCEIKIDVPNATTYSVNFEPGINYTVKMRTYDVNNRISSYSEEVTFLTEGIKPDNPSAPAKGSGLTVSTP